MQCYSHPESSAVGTCSSCGRAVCQDCVVQVSGRVQCRECLSQGRVKYDGPSSRVSPHPLALVSAVLAVVGAVGCMCAGSIGGLIFGLPAAITGWIARQQLLQSGEEKPGMEFAMIGLIGGGIEAGFSIILIILAIAGIALGGFWGILDAL